MPRTRKTTRYDADAVTIRRFFEQSWNVRAEQKAASQLISATNVEMEAAGVSSGVMSVMRRIRAMPEGKRGFHLFLLRRYADVLEKELHDRRSPRRPKRSQRRLAPRSLSSDERRLEAVPLVRSAARQWASGAPRVPSGLFAISAAARQCWIG
jgi:hypothetical protein